VRAARVLLAALAAGVLAAFPAAAQGPASNGTTPGAGTCGTCHPSERVAYASSRHAQEDVRCVSCHGGNDRALEVGAAHSGSFRGRPARASIPKLCASCHADEERMRPYNLPVDQYALYQTSGHGKALARGDTRVAVCSDCHGAHDILPPSDPRSRVHRPNIPKTCGHCHGDTTSAQGSISGKPTYPIYVQSVHAHALYDRGNPNAPTCVSCHGVHGAAPPSMGSVDKVCGQCHEVERRYVAAGPHAPQRGEASDRPQCVTCHGSHEVTAAQPERLASSCGTCHEADGPQARLGERLWNDYRVANGEVEQAAAILARAEAVPLNTEDYQARLEEARTYMREALPAAHAADAQVVESFTQRARAVAREVQSELHAKLGNLQMRRLLLVVFWFYLIITILILRRFQKAPRRG